MFREFLFLCLNCLETLLVRSVMRRFNQPTVEAFDFLACAWRGQVDAPVTRVLKKVCTVRKYYNRSLKFWRAVRLALTLPFLTALGSLLFDLNLMFGAERIVLIAIVAFAVWYTFTVGTVEAASDDDK